MDAIKRRPAAVGALVLSTVLLGTLSTILLGPPRTEPPALSAGTVRVHVEEVTIEGNHLISADRIQTGLKTHPGMVYNHDIVQEDFRQLIASHMFAAVEVWEATQPSGNVLVTFRLSDYQKLVRRVLFLGPKHLSDEELFLLAGVCVGTPISPVRNRMACQNIVRRLQEMGRRYAGCELISGDKPEDEEVIFQITEGPKLAVSSIEFTGNSFFTGTALRKLLAESPKCCGIITGTFNLWMADQQMYDMARLIEYYKSFGFLDVKISRELQLHPNDRDATLVFHISEGPRSTPTSVQEDPEDQPEDESSPPTPK
jgi:outer membrane protein assembly factor BamA